MIHGAYWSSPPIGYSVARIGIELLLQLDVIVEVLLGERVLVPVEAHLLGGLADPQRLLVAVAPGRIEHHRIVVADRLAHRFAHLDVFPPALRRVDLVGVPAGRLVVLGLLGIGLARAVDFRAGIGPDLVAAGADQAVDRQVRDLAGDVPQRDVDRADRADACHPRPRPQQTVEPLAVERVLAHHDRLEETDEARPVEARRVRRGAEKGVALDALVGDDAQEAKIALAGRPRRMVAIGRRRHGVPGEQGQGDVGDLHRGLLKGSASNPLRAWGHKGDVVPAAARPDLVDNTGRKPYITGSAAGGRAGSP